MGEVCGVDSWDLFQTPKIQSFFPCFSTQEFNRKFCATGQQYAKPTIHQIAFTITAPTDKTDHSETEGCCLIQCQS